MPVRAAVYYSINARSRILASAMAEGIMAAGDAAEVNQSWTFRSADADVAVFYGLEGSLPKVFADYRAAKKPVVFMDLGYWGRRNGGKYAGYHKITVNSRHPNEYFQRVTHGNERAKQLNLNVKEWNSNGKFVLIAGMSDRASIFFGYKPLQWEREAAKIVRAHTERPIHFRPKPGHSGSVEGAVLVSSAVPINASLREAHAVVSYQSNANIDGLICGIPSFCVEGAASAISHSDLSMIESPRRDVDRRQFCNDLAYCQWNLEEMKNGTAWRHLKNEGLIP